jgi:hypothetical protein
MRSILLASVLFLSTSALAGAILLDIIWDGPLGSLRDGTPPHLAAALSAPQTASPIVRAAEVVPQDDGAVLTLHSDSFVGARGSIPQYEYVVIEASSNNTEPVRLTGMRLRSGMRGTSIEIPRAHFLFTSREAAPRDDVRLSPGERAIILTGRSPAGISFKANVCSGYLETFQEFTPPLEYMCPLAEEELEFLFLDDSAAVLDAACVGYVESLDQCETPGVQADDYSRECEQFVHTVFSYDECVDRHQGEQGFMDDEWRLFLNEPDQLWNDDHERIELLNHAGEVIDALEY